ncbi:hypothetical protein FIBSPDRAFT_948511 [Athelia psychrophila]|uniref:Retrotransposon gag domain-containing protein n=1 Tax=Athelia psychrophila TaxID=1759441 RepID=A0A166QVB5_9AGAM|nr:hypothetical protein FIBSPDRAFT_948511 [Fibularhizoctonia sp. CBS 109695]
MGSADSPHQLIAVYNPESGVTPHSLLAWLAQCEDLFKIFGSRNVDKPLSIADQIRIMGHAIQEPRMQQWWLQGRDKFVTMAMDDWTETIKARWLPTSGVNDATRVCYRLKQGSRDFNSYATELSYHRNIVGDIIIPDITYKSLLLFGANSALMFDVLALPEFDVCATELTANKLESIMSARWNAIVSTGKHNSTGENLTPPWWLPTASILLILLWVITLWMLSSVTGAAGLIRVLLILAIFLFVLSWIKAAPSAPPNLLLCIGFWALVWATTLYILSALWTGGASGGGNSLGIRGGYGGPTAMEVPADTEAPAATEATEAPVATEATEVPVDTEARAATEVPVDMVARAAMGAQEGTAGTEAQRAGQVQEALEAMEAMGQVLARGVHLLRVDSLVPEEDPVRVGSEEEALRVDSEEDPLQVDEEEDPLQVDEEETPARVDEAETPARVDSLVPEEEPVLVTQEETAVWVEQAD